jgi:hypothetical protein
MSAFNLDINFNSEGWGPKVGETVAAFEDVPYAHFDKKDRLFRHADTFNLHNQHNNQRYQRNRYRGNDEVNAEFSYKHDSTEDSSFKLVDTAKSQTKSRFTAGKIIEPIPITLQLLFINATVFFINHNDCTITFARFFFNSQQTPLEQQ